nr:MAG TPA: hypothetical protein [Caudoviricetes sp.]
MFYIAKITRYAILSIETVKFIICTSSLLPDWS